MLGTYHLNGLFDILKEIHLIYDPETLWRYVLEQSCKYLQAEAGTFFLADADGVTMEVQAAFGPNAARLKEVPFKAGVGVCGWVLQFHQPALVPDVGLDNRFSRAVDMVTGIHTKSLLCVPVITKNRTYGVLELINRKSGQFGPQDQEFMTVLGRQTATAYQNLLLFNELTHTKVLLESTVENLSGGLIAADKEGLITLFNPSAARILDLPSHQVIGRPAKDVLNDHPWFVTTLQRTLMEKSPAVRLEITLPLKGHASRVGYTTILISDHQKNLLGSGIIFQKLQ